MKYLAVRFRTPVRLRLTQALACMLLSLGLLVHAPLLAQKGKKTEPAPTPAPASNGVRIEDIYMGRFFAASPDGFNFLKDDRYFLRQDENSLLRCEVESGKAVDTFLHRSWLKNADTSLSDIPEFELSEDENQVLLITSQKRIYRHSREIQAFVFDRKSRKLQAINQGKPFSNPLFDHGSRQLAFTCQNNIWLQDLTSGSLRQLTTDGKINAIINGSSDWVYEEEFSNDHDLCVRMFEFSPDDKYIAFLQFDESAVPEFSMDMYKGLYPTQDRFKYPKAGERNSTVRAFFYSLATGTRTEIPVGAENDQYLPRLKFTGGENVLSLVRMNRWQNQLELLLAYPERVEPKVAFRETSETYVDLVDYKITYLDGGRQFLYLSDQDGYMHAYIYTTLDGKKIRQVTQGPWEILAVVGVDEKAGKLYYLSTEKGATERHLYSIGLDGQGKTLLTPEAGMHEATFSPSCRYYMNSYSTSSQPPIHRLCSAAGKTIQVLEDNKALAGLLASLKLPEKTFLKVKNKEGQELNGWMMKPANFDPKAKYPVLMYVYGGPGAQTVENRYDPINTFFFVNLTQAGYIVVSVDGRGTGGRGAAFKKATYLNLGKLELEDQVSVNQWLRTLSYVDTARIGIWGWSFGGYLTSLCLTKAPTLFKMGLAVAPVTNWRFYDSIYTERFLRTPKDNPKGYDDNSPINFANGLKSKYFLIHGTADDNVHVQNAMMMIKALVNANRPFDQFLYPDRNHGIYGGMTRVHLYNMMRNYILKNL